MPFPAVAPRAKIGRMNSRPIAYHVTFGTYGTRLHGDARGTVDRAMNQPGDPIIGADAGWWEMERKRLKFEPVVLTPEQMCFVESALLSVCERGGWELHTGAGGPDHVHNLISADADGEAVRKWLKRWLGEALSAKWPRPDGSTWWAEGGSVKWVWTSAYYRAVFDYVDRQRASGPTVPRSER
jgi:REP element-mobilizing transposase RayT